MISKHGWQKTSSESKRKYAWWRGCGNFKFRCSSPLLSNWNWRSNKRRRKRQHEYWECRQEKSNNKIKSGTSWSTVSRDISQVAIRTRSPLSSLREILKRFPKNSSRRHVGPEGDALIVARALGQKLVLTVASRTLSSSLNAQHSELSVCGL